LEAAPNTWSGGSADPTIIWCNSELNVPNLLTGGRTSVSTAQNIGAGFANTQRMLRGCSNGAANAAASYNGGGKSDWHVPSRIEILYLCYAQEIVPGLARDVYWSSTETDSNGAWAIGISNCEFLGNPGKTNTFRVRPVRAFG
jgi:hypothetical protein